MRKYFVYILASRSKTLYIGVTGSLGKRVWEHKQKLVPGFTKRYNVDRLVYYEWTHDPNEAISREKKLKGWRRVKKVSLVEQSNPDWCDLAADWPLEDKWQPQRLGKRS